MLHVQQFTFNEFQENTYVLYDETKEAIIIDPGCNRSMEFDQLKSFIEKHELVVKHNFNTHCHIDHILGNHWVFTQFDLRPEFHQSEQILYDRGSQIAQTYGLQYTPGPDVQKYWQENDILKFGNTSLKLLLCPGHSPGSLCLYNETSKILIAGDVLFFESIGRTDLPLGNHQHLVDSITNKLYLLPEDVLVYPGHGPRTTIGHEKIHNPFVKG